MAFQLPYAKFPAASMNSQTAAPVAVIHDSVLSGTVALLDPSVTYAKLNASLAATYVRDRALRRAGSTRAALAAATAAA